MNTAITYTLTLDGQVAPPPVRAALSRIVVEEHVEMASMVRLRLALAPRADGRGWAILDEDTFPRLRRVGVQIGVGGETIHLASAHVIDLDARFGGDEGSLLDVVAMDPTVLMHLEEKVRAWPDMQDSDVANSVFASGAYRFRAVVESTRNTRPERDQTLLQRGSDIQFLQQLAERNGFECYVAVDPRTGEIEGHFHPPKLTERPQGVLTFNMGDQSNVRSMRARHDLLGAVQARTRTVEVDAGRAEASSSDRSEQNLGESTTTDSERPRVVLLRDLGFGKAGEAQKYAQAVVDRTALSMVLEGTLDTAAYGGLLRARRPVNVRGIAAAYNGTWYVERVQHVIPARDAYLQHFTLRRNATGTTGKEDFRDGPE